jgi:uncharacterized RDD family membrane protein YckC
VGSRLSAFIIDFMIQALVIILGVLFINVSINEIILENDRSGYGAMAAILILIFVVFFGYFLLFELIWNGQTPGKRVFGLRAIRDNGQPLTFSHILVRGLFRVAADILYIGLFVIMFSKQHKRLGDMAAGTVVVSEHYLEAEEIRLYAPTLTLPEYLEPYAAAMTPAERRAVDDWLRRRHDLPDGGDEIERQLWAYFQRKEELNRADSQ